MATVTYVGEILADGSQEKRANYVLPRKFKFKSVDARAYDILTHTSAPKLFSEHPQVSNLRCTRRYTEHTTDEKGDTWILVCEYGGDTDSTGSGVSVTVKPWDLPPENIVFTHVDYEKVIESTYTAEDFTNGDRYTKSQRVVNSAGDMFANAPMGIKRNLLMRFSYNLKTFKFTWIYSFLGTLNKNPETVLGMVLYANTARINELTATFIEVRNASGSINQSKSYWRIDIAIEVRADVKHNLIVQNMGYKALDSNDKLAYIYLEDGTYKCDSTKKPPQIQPIDAPAMLDNDGHVVASPSVTTVYNRVFAPFWPETWTKLKLPAKSPENW